MINKNLKIALVCFAALFLISLVYLVFAFIFNIWPFNNEDFSQMSPCDDALTQVAIAQAALNEAYHARGELEAEGKAAAKVKVNKAWAEVKNLCGLQGKKESYDFFSKSRDFSQSTSCDEVTVSWKLNEIAPGEWQLEHIGEPCPQGCRRGRPTEIRGRFPDFIYEGPCIQSRPFESDNIGWEMKEKRVDSERKN